MAGALIGQGGFGLVDTPSDGVFVTGPADLALFTVLFTDGRRAGLPALREGRRLSGRALGLAVPLTMIGTAVPAHYLAGLDWTTSLPVGAILAPPTRSSPPPSSAAPTCRCARAACSTWSPASTTAPPCPS